ncbi:MAG: hypothetical protein WBB56_04950, partial [Psychrobacillus psychrotolerans]
VLVGCSEMLQPTNISFFGNLCMVFFYMSPTNFGAQEARTVQRSFVSEISKYYCIAITYLRKKF